MIPKEIKQTLSEMKVISLFLQNQLELLENNAQEIFRELSDKNLKDSVFEFIWNDLTLKELLDELERE